MPTNLKDLKIFYKQAKQVLKYMRKLYKSGAALRMLNPLLELNNAKEQVKYYAELIKKYKSDNKQFNKKWKKYTAHKNKENNYD